MANTWTINADGSAELNGVAIPNSYSVKFASEWNTELDILETYVEVSVPSTSEETIIENALAVVPNVPTLAQLGIYIPRYTMRSAVGDTINVAALSLVQQSPRPDKLGV